MKNAAIKAIGVAGMAALVPIGIFAATDRREAEPDAAALAKASITLVQAVTVEENHTRGRAAKAEFELTPDGKPVYKIEVISGSKTWDVRVNAASAAVLFAKEDQADADEDSEQSRER